MASESQYCPRAKYTVPPPLALAYNDIVAT